MSDSGRVLGDCRHGRTPEWCCECLRAELVGLQALYDDAQREVERLRELARSCARDLRLTMQVLMTRSHAVESIADRLEREADAVD